MEHRELIILGAGPAGLTAAIYAQRSGLDALLLEKGAVGGQVTTTSDVENWPGAKRISGFDLVRSLQEHAEHFEADIRTADLTGVDFSQDKKIVHTDKGDVSADAVIICTGAHHRLLEAPGELEFAGRGVSYCAVCDGPFFRNETVVVVGGGNTAVEEAEYLTRFAAKVYLVHRRDKFRADALLVRRVMTHPKVEPVLDSVVETINGAAGVTSVTVKHVKTGVLTEIAATGVFIFVGKLPNVEAFKTSGLALTMDGWIKVDHDTLETSIPGVFAAGDVRETSLRQIITAAADGARAAMSAYGYIAALKG